MMWWMTGFIICAVIINQGNALPLRQTQTNDPETVSSPPATQLLPEATTEQTVAGKGFHLEPGELFEGDLKISEEKIRQFYNLEVPSVEKRSVTASSVNLWVNGTVYYNLSSGLTTAEQTLIRDAMDYWEDNTCLRFLQRTSQNDYIFFTDSDSGCYSTSIGRDGGEQIINLANGCKHFGTILHEIGHAVGFWHEQSRPDRDSFVTVNETNIITGKKHNFMKRSDSDIDYQGVGYDYGSIMHYSKTAFSNCIVRSTCPTLAINNPTEYANQGSPTVGQRSALSSRDITQANRLYTCSGNGLKGVLKVYVRYAPSLPDTDVFSDPDPYVRLTAVDSNGNQVIKTTSKKDGTTNLTWNEWIDFGGREWQFFRIRIWDDDLFGDDSMSMSQTVVLTGGNETFQKHCVDTACNGYLWFDYNLILDGPECSPNPCLNGGTCIEEVASYRCSCTSTWDGDLCQHRKANLTVPPEAVGAI